MGYRDSGLLWEEPDNLLELRSFPQNQTIFLQVYHGKDEGFQVGLPYGQIVLLMRGILFPTPHVLGQTIQRQLQVLDAPATFDQFQRLSQLAAQVS